MKIDDLRFEILDELYFLKTFEDLSEDLDIEEDLLEIELKKLLDEEWIQQYSFDDNHKDYIKQSEPDIRHMDDHAYLATKKGLLHHTGMRTP